MNHPAATLNRPGQTRSPIMELRQYTLNPGMRDTLIELFDREFVESQEALGITVIGQFREPGDPDRFVWLRGFPDMAARAGALAAFYGGPVWKAHRTAANATMIDSDNVLLLRPAQAASGFSPENCVRPPVGATVVPASRLVATICHLDKPADDEFTGFFDHEIRPALLEAGAPILASFVTEQSANNFPALPVREGEHVFAWFTRFADQAALDRHSAASDEITGRLARRLKRAPEILRLSPTSRSRLA